MVKVNFHNYGSALKVKNSLVSPITQYTHVRTKNSNTKGSSPYVVEVIFHTLRNYS